MKQKGFNERLDSLLVRAAMRLQERMRLAYFRGNLAAYLKRTGLAVHINKDRLRRGSLLELQDEAAIALAMKVREAYRHGYLKDFLQQINMLELIQEKTHVLASCPVMKRDSRAALSIIAGKKEKTETTTEEKQNRRKNFKLIK